MGVRDRRKGWYKRLRRRRRLARGKERVRRYIEILAEHFPQRFDFTSVMPPLLGRIPKE